jgi:tRNA(Ile)-lysidine synthase
VTLVRPLLDKARQDLREYNQTHGLTWLEDPSNQNRSFARIRARDYLRSRPRLRADLLETAREMRVGLREEKRLLLAEAKRVVSLDSHGVITLKKLCCAELLYHLLRVASGTGAPIDRAQIRRLRGDMARAGFTAATLAGAQVTRVKDRFVIARDPVFYLGRKDLGSQKGQPHHHTEILGKLSRKLSSDSPTIWDGRYSAAGSGHISAAGLMRGDLSSTETRALKAVAAPARGGVPVTQAKRDESRLIGAGVWGDIEVKSLVQTRLETALGGSFT